MTVLLEWKDKLVRFYGKNDVLILPLVRFLVAFAVFSVISRNFGYMARVSQTPVTLILSLICSLMPVNVMMFLAAVVLLLDFYALSLEVCLVALLLFLLLYFVYFRFSPKDGYSVVLTPLCFRWGIPYVMPAAVGLLGGLASVFAVLCGTVVYFFVDGVRENASALGEVAEDAENATSKIVVVINQLIANREMYLFLAVFFVTTLLVHAIRKLDMEYSWTVAWISGILFESIGMIAGYMLLGISGKTAGILVGGVISVAVSLVIQFFAFNVDYSRTERLQFEDDEYYYYVKAIPKAFVPVSNKKVKRINGDGEHERIDRKQLAEEMNIDEDMLK